VDELSVLVWAPRGRDAALAAQLLQRGGHTAVAVDDPEQIAELVSRAGCAVITEEALQPEFRALLVEALAAQPAWSDFPMILFAPRGSGSVEALRAANVFGNVTVLERPVQTRTLLSAVSAALRGRRRQYEARGAIQRRDEFLAMLGHELRNPLAAITLAVEDIARQSGDIAARPREILRRQSHHLSRLVEDLLDVTRVTMGKITLKAMPVDLGKLLGRSVQGAQALARQRGGEIVFDGAIRNAIVDGDPVRLEEVFANLLSNAIKYSPENARIELRLRADDKTCVVDVIDHGVGIAPEMLPRVFDLFAQADATIDRSAGGLGIGLTLVKSLVELHGGSVLATSLGKGCGSTFTVQLPRSSQQAEPTNEIEIAPATAGLRVVVIDDNADVLELTTIALESEGCQVMTADNGLTGLELLRTQPFDVAFVDIGLPGMDGYEVARQTRAAGVDARMIAVSGYGQDRDRKRAIDAGFDLHLTKPVTVDQMVRATRP
jgi:signal transduction histidine kinase